MATVAENIKLDDAIQKSKSMNNTSYLWIIEENVLDLDIPQDHIFYCIGVIWHSFTDICTVCSILLSTRKGVFDAMGLKEDNSPFANFEELRQSYPKLFEVEAEFRILQR